MTRIIDCQPAYVSRAADMLASAFLHDPLYDYVFPGLQNREAQITWDMSNLIRFGMQFGKVTVTADLAGCAMWLPPDETDFTEERLGQAGMLDAARHIGDEADARMVRFLEASEIIHRRIIPSPHWYLVVLGVDPAYQGRGIGRALLAGTLVKADEGGFPAYLETTKPGNLGFYERSGFRLRHEQALPDGGPVV